MLTWIECEDYREIDGEAQVIDDWGAAAQRYLELNKNSSVSYSLPFFDSAICLAIRYRCSEDTAILVNRGEQRIRIILEATGKGWNWKIIENVQNNGRLFQIASSNAKIDLDVIFASNKRIDLPEKVDEINRMAGSKEAENATLQRPPELDFDYGYLPDASSWETFPTTFAKRIANDFWPVLEKLSAKPCPYIVKAFDTSNGTNYNSDFVWHAFDKEKRWEFAWSKMLGLINPNSDLAYLIGFGVDEQPASYSYKFQPMLHLADTLVYNVCLGEPLRCEVMFRCFDSNTLIITIVAANWSYYEKKITISEVLAKDNIGNPPVQRWTLPGQKFGSGVTTTAGGLAWISNDERGSAAACFYEWVRNRCRGRRLLATLISEANCEIVENSESAIISRQHALIVPPGKTASLKLSLNLRRFTIDDTWNPELTPELYSKETEQKALRAGFMSCASALNTNIESCLLESIEPYKNFPAISLPDKTWESAFYACLELPRASTFSPYGELKTPFYNFCRVHAHDPFGWWSYGMHAHEDLCTLFNNIAAPHLSADYIRGHINHQQDDGKYPYGVSHAKCWRTSTDEATAPLIVWEAWNCYLWSGDRTFLSEAYESGKRSHSWWLKTRDYQGEGLCHWVNKSWESVRDDNALPTWDLIPGQYQEALDLNCYLLVEEQALSQMARELGLDDEANYYSMLAERRAKLMNAYMWHEEDKCYYGICEVLPAWSNVKDISSFFPLWAGLAPDGRYQPLIELIKDPNTFGLPYGPPSLAANEPRFNPENHWMGANWVEMSLFPILGLRKYGYYKDAADVAYKNTQMVFDELNKYGHFREYFNSIDGSGTDLIDYIWTAIPAFFIVNVFFGIEPAADGLSIMPVLPMNWPAISLSNLKIRGNRISISISRDSSVEIASAKIDGATAKVIENRGVFIPWEQVKNGLSVEIIQPMDISEEHKAPPEAPADWADVPPHEYPGDSELVALVKSIIKNKNDLR